MNITSLDTGHCYWLTGLSASGKTTLANAFRDVLERRKIPVQVLDGDVMRRGLNRDLGYTREARAESVRRVAEVATYLVDAGFVVIVAMISPYAQHRELARQRIGEKRFFEVFVDASLTTCIGRDPRGLYRQAHAGALSNFTGISDPYERPLSPALHVETDGKAVTYCMNMLVNHYTCLHIKAGASRSRHLMEND